jgi:SAM-dependent methyltransferase
MNQTATLEFFEKIWMDSSKYSDPSVDFWNLRAEEYNESLSKETPRLVREEKVNQFVKNGWINKDSSVLDIGCGSGQLAVELGKKVKEVTAMDYSKKMLDYTKMNAEQAGLTNITTILSDWDHFENNKPYDFVIASMSPAIKTPDHLYKMMKTSCGGCYLSGFVKRYSALKNKCYDVINETNKRQYHKLNYIFNVLWLKGIFSEISYEEGVHQRVYSIEKAKEIYAFELGIKENEIKRKQLDVYLETKAINGLIKEEMIQTKGELLWRC